jgi:hypothetical protein
MKIGIFFSRHTTTYRRPKKKKNGAAAQWSSWFSWAEIAKNGPTIGALQKTFFFGKKFGIYFELSHFTTYSRPKKYWEGGGTVVHWVEIAKWANNGPKISQKWALCRKLFCF